MVHISRSSVKWIGFFVFSFVFLSLSYQAYAYSDAYYGSTSMIFLISRGDYYFIPILTSEQNLVKSGSYNITITLYKQDINYPLGYGKYKETTSEGNVTGNITTPSGGIDTGMLFTNNNNGNYTLNYTFNEIGTYRLDIRVTNQSIGYSEARTYIYVGRFPVNVEIVSETDYTYNDYAEIDVFAQDENSNPLTGSSCLLTINYPNKTVWVSEASMTELDLGRYYYNFITPNINGTYSSFVNCTSGVNSNYASDTFRVWKYTEDVMGYLQDINETGLAREIVVAGTKYYQDINNIWFVLLFVGIAFFLLVFGYVTKNSLILFISAVALVIAGLVLLVYGIDVPTGEITLTNSTNVTSETYSFATTKNAYTNGLGLILILIGIYVSFIAAFRMGEKEDELIGDM